MKSPARTDEIQVLFSDWPEHELLDSGNRRKLERFGPYRLIRSEPKAWWTPDLGDDEWRKAAAEHTDERGWQAAAGTPRQWQVRFDNCAFELRLTGGSKHVGVFPEQSPHWRWIQSQARAEGRSLRVLSLFGYTGAATLMAAAAGGAVTHVDASRPAMSWARRNQELSGLGGLPIRWILDDAFKFVKREVRRQQRYDALILDPPSFGRGPANEVWKVEQQLAELLADCRQLLAERARFVVLTLSLIHI